MTSKKITAAVMAYGNPRDVATWSGIPFHMLKVLEQRFDVTLVVEKPWAPWYQPLGRALKAVSLRRFQYTASRRFTAAAMAGSSAALRTAKPDVVFAISCSPLAHSLVDSQRVINIADATVRQMLGYYDVFTHSTGGGAAGADGIEARLVKNAFLSLYPSTWALRSALDDYDAAPDRVLEIAWGSNIAAGDFAARELPGGPLRLLFVGAEWERKGGPMAVAIAAELAARGIDCHLDIVGSTADVMAGRPLPENVTFHGFLRKGVPAQAATLDALFANASFFLLPTRAECWGIVFGEAASRALPSISIATGGIPSAVKAGETGILLPLSANAGDFAEAIAAIVASPARYTAMSAAALADARHRLNWDSWADAVLAAVSVRLAR